MNNELNKLIDQVSEVLNLDRSQKNLLRSLVQASYNNGKTEGAKEVYSKISENS